MLHSPLTHYERVCTQSNSPPLLFFFNDTATTEIYTLSLHAALPISPRRTTTPFSCLTTSWRNSSAVRSEEHTSELQSHSDLVCRLLLEKKKTKLSSSLYGIDRVGETI